jgi:hypothetical protein
MLRIVYYTRYDDPLDLRGKDLISLLDAPKAKAQAVIVALKETSAMKRRLMLKSKVRAPNTGEIADELHEFLDAYQGEFQLKQILFKKGRVMELVMKGGGE